MPKTRQKFDNLEKRFLNNVLDLTPAKRKTVEAIKASKKIIDKILISIPPNGTALMVKKDSNI